MTSTGDNLDNSTTALLQSDASDTDHLVENHDADSSSLTNGDQQKQQQSQDESQPNNITDNNTLSSQQQQRPSSEGDINSPPLQQNGETATNLSSDPNNTQGSSSSSPDDLKIVDENQPEELQNQTSELETNKSSVDPSAQSPNDHSGINTKEDQIEEDSNSTKGDKAPIAPSKKSSRSSRVRSALNSLPREKVRKARMATSIEDIGSLRLWKGIVAEFLGTLLLTLVGCGSCINLQGVKNVTSPVVQIALCFGLSVATIVWAIGHVSGGHINPAVTVAMLATRKISLVKAAFFIIFQLIGAVVGAGLLYGMTPSKYHGNLGATLVNKNLNVGQAVGVEIFITFVLVFVVFASVDSKRRDLNGSTPLTIGLSVTMCHLFAVDFTGSSMNTARSFGPALVIGNWTDHWVYWLGPILGGALAGLLYENLFAVNASLQKAKACLLSSDYDDERYQAQKMKIRIIEEDPDEPKEDVPLSDKNSNADGDPSNA